MTKTFNTKQWRKEMYEHHKITEGEYPTQQHIKDKKNVKYTTYHCGEWTQKVCNPKKEAKVCKVCYIQPKKKLKRKKTNLKKINYTDTRDIAWM